MGISYKKMSRRPVIFLRLFGISVEDFVKILHAYTPIWEKYLKDSSLSSKRKYKLKKLGPKFKLEVSDMLLMLMLYYRSYISQEFVGYLFGLDDSNVSRLIKRSLYYQRYWI